MNGFSGAWNLILMQRLLAFCRSGWNRTNIYGFVKYCLSLNNIRWFKPLSGATLYGDRHSTVKLHSYSCTIHLIRTVPMSPSILFIFCGRITWKTTPLRRGWDSNPRDPCESTGLANLRLKPLGHPSNLCVLIRFTAHSINASESPSSVSSSACPIWLGLNMLSNTHRVKRPTYRYLASNKTVFL